MSCIRTGRILTGGLLLALLAGCNRETPVQGPTYTSQEKTQDAKAHVVFAVHPLYNPQLLHKKYEPLMRYLSANITDTVFDLEASNDYADYEDKLKRREPQFSLPNPYHATMARQWGYEVIAKMGNDDVFRGIWIVRRDSPVKVPADLKGKVVAYPAPTALAAAMMPQLYLQKHGVDVQTQLKNVYVGTHNSSIMNVYLRQSAASATWPVAWESFQKANPKEAAELKIIWQTPQLIQNAVIARKDVPPELVQQVRKLLVGLKDSDEGRALLVGIDTTSFEPSNDEQYEIVSQFMKEYDSKVRKKAP